MWHLAQSEIMIDEFNVMTLLSTFRRHGRVEVTTLRQHSLLTSSLPPPADAEESDGKICRQAAGRLSAAA